MHHVIDCMRERERELMCVGNCSYIAKEGRGRKVRRRYIYIQVKVITKCGPRMIELVRTERIIGTWSN